MQFRQMTDEEVTEFKRWQSLTEEEKIAEKTIKYAAELEKNARCDHKNLTSAIYQCKYHGPKVTATFGYQADYLHVGVCISCDDCGKTWDVNSVEATITG